jgi:hypothetical protein
VTQIHIDTLNIRPQLAKAFIAFFTVLADEPACPAVKNFRESEGRSASLVADEPAQSYVATEAEEHALDHLQMAQEMAETKPEPVAPTAEPEKAKRTRRTKAEMEAARQDGTPTKNEQAAEKLAEARAAIQENVEAINAIMVESGKILLTPTVPVPSVVQEQPKAEPAPTPSDLPDPTQDELRQALLDYTKAKGKDNSGDGLRAGAELLADFECKRVSDLANRSADDRREFLKLARQGAAA